jgi:hypothetical protein
MNSAYKYISRIFLILSFACAIFVSAPQARASSHSGGRLIVQRSPTFGTDLIIRLSIDGKEVANIPRGQRFDGSVSAGHHVVTVLSMPNTEARRPTSMRVTIRPGHTNVFTAGWSADRLVLRRSSLSNATLETPTVGPSKH